MRKLVDRGKLHLDMFADLCGFSFPVPSVWLYVCMYYEWMDVRLASVWATGRTYSYRYLRIYPAWLVSVKCEHSTP
jgi:hypothetical protein